MGNTKRHAKTNMLNFLRIIFIYVPPFIGVYIFLGNVFVILVLNFLGTGAGGMDPPFFLFFKTFSIQIICNIKRLK